MATDQYAACPCGSGKKFKWCCQPIYAGINRAFEQDAQGQHDAAMRLMEQVTVEHGGNPEAWGQKAKLLYAHGKLEEAEEALEKAFAINRNYPYGLLLKAVFRFQEGEIGGALLLARRAAEAYDPEARDYLAEAYSVIYECEMKMNRPVAARAALRMVVHCQPAAEEPRTLFEQVFGEASRLPAAVRREYTLAPVPASAGDRRAAWDRALQSAQSPRLSELARAFDELTKQNAADAPAWFNLGLSRAWMGDNAAALESLNRYLDLETDEEKATTAAALTEVLRCGQGMEESCDYHEYSFAFQYRDPQVVVALIEEWQQAGRLVSPQQQEEGVLYAMVLELTSVSVITVGRPAADVGRLAGYLMIAGAVFRMWGPIKEALGRVREEVRQRLGLALGEAQERPGPIQFHDVISEALVFPTNLRDPNATAKVMEHAQRYYEETWIHQPRRSLSGNTPIDAAGHAVLRKKLRGVVRFIQESAARSLLAGYDFDRLRHKLGLIEGAAPAAATPTATGTADVRGMNATDLAGLKVESLTDEQLEQAFVAAQKLDAEDLAASFAHGLTSRPPRPDATDRFPLFAFLTQHALKNGQADAALDYVNEGERVDCEQNEGRRRNDYELRRGQVHVKRREADAAADVFQRLIERVPDELKYRGSAAEAMLTLKQAERAQRFAEDGLAVARQRGDRDSEQYLQELAEAAKRQKG
jgi:tetratricopeptide (TPR) repeat protein